MTGHPITCEDIKVKLSHLNKRKGDMRKANFKMPYIQDLSTQESIYKNYISD